VYESSEKSDYITKLTLHQQVTIIGQEGSKLIMQQMGLTKSIRRLI